ncbi:hypothetical protein G113_08145 [Aeromonas molluscorum 848]|uniref:Uncharacterized protein n=1 Tax=Aeromonas molluscorum 848 TaxID=1268236 RepID=R1H4V4_9GAMM|nr:hypothetical protein G113_08145 [Aeromonas molluscorum 848]
MLGFTSQHAIHIARLDQTCLGQSLGQQRNGLLLARAVWFNRICSCANFNMLSLHPLEAAEAATWIALNDNAL